MVPSAILVALLAQAALVGADPVVVVGRHFSLVIEPFHGSVSVVGLNAYGQLGTGSTDDQLEPVVVMVGEGEPVSSGAAGAFHSLVLTESGNVYAAGRNNYGQLGDGTTTDSAMFVQVQLPEGTKVIAVAAGYQHSLLLTDGFEVYAFGQNKYGQLGDGSAQQRNMPVPIGSDWADVACSNGTRVRAIAAGYDFSYFLLADTTYGHDCDGTVYAAGMGLGGQLGTSAREAINPLPLRVDVDAVDKMTAGTAHGMFLLKSGLIAMTGANFDGQLGGVAPDFVVTPTVMLPDVPAASGVFAGGDSSCYLSAEQGGLMAMGSNRQGQIGLGGNTTVAPPLEVMTLGTVEQVALGESHSLFATSHGAAAVFGSGSNMYGELGDSTQESTDVPVESVPRLTTNTSTHTMTATTTMVVTVTVTEPNGATTTKTVSDVPTGSTTTQTATRGSQQAFTIGVREVGLVSALVLGLLLCWTGQRLFCGGGTHEEHDETELSSA